MADNSTYEVKNDPRYRCRVCGLFQADPPWGEIGTTPTYAYCECCGAEFGYHDSSLMGIRRWRQQWLNAGAEWSSLEYKPEDWNLEKQLSHIPPEFR